MTTNIITIEIPCPEEIFDSPTAAIHRVRRVPIWRFDALQASQNPTDVYENMSALIPRWQGVFDCESGEPLENPENNPAVFARLDMNEQFPWMVKQLKLSPK